MDRKYVWIGLLFVTVSLSAGQVFSQQFQYIEDEVSVATKPSIDELLKLKKISEVKTDIHAKTGQIPEDHFTRIKEAAGAYEEREFEDSVITWDAPNICYHPLYFEDIGLERYSQETGLLQPALSGAHFFSRAATLPLQAVFKRPLSCEWPLGLYRPGNCNPYLHYTFPW